METLESTGEAWDGPIPEGGPAALDVGLPSHSHMLSSLALVLLSVQIQEEPGLRFERMHTTEQIQAAFAALAMAHPRWIRAGSIGHTVQGRKIPYLEVTDHEADGPKAGLWIDGAIHGYELASAEPALGVAEGLRRRIARREPPAFLERVVVYLVPVINVDARRLCIQPPFLCQRHNLRLVDDDADGKVDEDGQVDPNADGRISPITGADGRDYESRDQDGDGRCGEDPLGGIDLNRNFPVLRAAHEEGWTPEPETQAIVEFWERHPGIQLAIGYHTSGNLLLWPPGSIAESDLLHFERVSSLFEEALAGGVWRTEEVQSRLTGRSMIGTSMEWYHSARGALAFTVEMKPTAPDLALPEDSGWHACLGKVRIPRVESGYSRPSDTQLENELEDAVARQTGFLLRLAELLPIDR